MTDTNAGDAPGDGADNQIDEKPPTLTSTQLAELGYVPAENLDSLRSLKDREIAQANQARTTMRDEMAEQTRKMEDAAIDSIEDPEQKEIAQASLEVKRAERRADEAEAEARRSAASAEGMAARQVATQLAGRYQIPVEIITGLPTPAAMETAARTYRERLDTVKAEGGGETKTEDGAGDGGGTQTPEPDTGDSQGGSPDYDSTKYEHGEGGGIAASLKAKRAAGLD